ncbi:MAG: polyprenyl synthetase family protein [Candidatus Micrarchaeaceae archaeon]
MYENNRKVNSSLYDKATQEELKTEIKNIMLSYLEPEKAQGREYYEGLTDYIERGGHYSRPLLFIYAAKAFGLKLDSSLLLMAATIEMSEEAILKYDDMQDHALLRRGGPTTNAKYGDELAVHYAAVLHDKTRQILRDYSKTLKAEVSDRLNAKFDEIATITASGQLQELLFMYNIRDFSKVDDSLYYNIAKAKTSAYTIYGPLQFAAIVAEQNEEVLDALKAIGEPAGIAFQINDDILDFLKPKNFGKTQYGDLYEGKYTLIMAHAYDAANDSDKKFINSMYQKSRSEREKAENKPKIERLVEIVNKTGSLEYALEQRDKYMRLSISELSKYAGYFKANKATIELGKMLLDTLSRDGVDASELIKIKRE